MKNKPTHKFNLDTRLRAARFAIVLSRWNESVTSKLLEGAWKAFGELDIPKDHVDVFHVSGSFELPQAAAGLARTKQYSAIIPLGCLVRGETPHFDHICRSVCLGLDEVGRQSRIATVFGVLTADNMSQAMERAGGKLGNKGEEAVLAALELASVLMQIDHAQS